MKISLVAAVLACSMFSRWYDTATLRVPHVRIDVVLCGKASSCMRLNKDE
jgi:hypothetical protein